MATTVTGELVARASRLRDEAWQAEVMLRTELCLMDSLTCFSAGRDLEQHAPTAEAVPRSFGGSGGAFAQAFLYGQAGNALDFDDTLIGHPGSPVVGAVLAAGVRDTLPSERLLRGIAAGYEVHGMLAAAAYPDPEQASLVRSVGVWDTLAAAIGVAVALELDDAALERTLGVGVSHSLLPTTAKWYDRPVPALKNNLGWAAAGGVLAVDLAVAGQHGVTDPLEGNVGMWRMAGSDRWRSVDELIAKPAVLRVGFKRFPACWHIQEYLSSLASLLPELPGDDEIAAITVTGPRDVERFTDSDLRGPADVAFSLPGTFALLLSGLEPGPAWGSSAERPRILRYAGLQHFALSEHRSIVVETRGGSRLEAAVDVSNFLDPASDGLDEAGVRAKHERWADAELRASAGTPERLYARLRVMTAGREMRTRKC